MTATITSKGQITIPKKIREYLSLKSHEKVNFIPYGKDKVILTPIRGTILDLKGILKHKVKGPIDFHALREKMKTKVAKETMEEMK